MLTLQEESGGGVHLGEVLIADDREHVVVLRLQPFRAVEGAADNGDLVLQEIGRTPRRARRRNAEYAETWSCSTIC